MKIFILIITSVLTFSLSAQTEDILKKKTNSNKSSSWNDLAEYYVKQRDSIGLNTAANKALELALKEKDLEEQGKAFMHIAQLERICSGRYTESYLNLLKRASDLLLQQKSKYAAHCLQSISQKYNTSGEYDKALDYLFQAEKEGLDNSPEDLGSIYCDIGYAYLYKGVPDSARIYTEKALQYATNNKDTLSLTVSYSLLGIINRRENNYSMALKYYLKCADLYEQQKEWRRLSTTWCNIAVLYTDWEKYAQAIEFADRAIEIIKRHQLSEKELSRALLISGPPLVSTKQTDKAIENYKSALPNLNNSYQRRSCLFGLVKAYYELNIQDSVNNYMQQLESEFVRSKATYTDSYYIFKGLIALRHRQFDKAIEYYEKSIELRKHNKNGIVQRTAIDTYLNLSEAYKMGPHDYKKALYYKDIAFKLQDSIYQQKHNEMMSEYYVQFETANKELEINRLQIKHQEERYQSLLIISISGILIVALSIAWLYNRIIRLKKEKETTLLSQRIDQKEKDFLNLQQETEQRLTRKYIDGLETERKRLATELHDDICNSMMALELNINEERKSQQIDIPYFIKRLSEIRNRVRNVSHELMPPSFQYATIDEMLTDFITHLNLPPEIKAEYKSTPHVHWENIPSKIGFELYRIVQESTSNALKYAFPSKITVELKLENNNLSVSIEDDGIGFDTNKKNKGIGIQTIAQRIQSINGTFSLISRPNEGTKIRVGIRLKNRHKS